MMTLGVLVVSVSLIATRIDLVEALSESTSETYGIGFKYHTFEEMSDFLNETASRYQDLVHLYSIGESVRGRELWVVAISSSPRTHIIGKPEVKYVGNIHGNEVVGRELLLHLIYLLVTTYDTDPEITRLLDTTRIHILPSMNPDGFDASKPTCSGVQGRVNANGFDLNRNFPDFFRRDKLRIQPETLAIMNWLSQYQFVLSGSMHGGALVASYPFDNKPNIKYDSYLSTPSISPDDDVFQHLALTYSRNHGSMHLGKRCSAHMPAFENGITNGAGWYTLAGGMQDFNYIGKGCMEITFELSCCKFPPARDLPFYWKENRNALIKFLAQVHRGVRGLVLDENQKPIAGASITVDDRKVNFHTTNNGEFWRILLPGVYNLKVNARGYYPRKVQFEVFESKEPTTLMVTLPARKLGRRKDTPFIKFPE